MPLQKGRSQATISRNIEELTHGKTFARTKARYGKRKAISQAVAIAYRTAGRSRRKKKQN